MKTSRTRRVVQFHRLPASSAGRRWPFLSRSRLQLVSLIRTEGGHAYQSWCILCVFTGSTSSGDGWSQPTNCHTHTQSQDNPAGWRPELIRANFPNNYVSFCLRRIPLFVKRSACYRPMMRAAILTPVPQWNKMLR